ncbi:hypothetical protein [Haloimpatiens massiliensis]|uniref:hypothetical protein n=1 Tax=Haloimpatiens massiliensis TaxID=1658110 RepID=UPI000C859585|nr:hypothetical protein [Haloimpatiens massiliensis]
MSNRRVINNYFIDVNNLADLLAKLVNSYRLLVGGADELNKIALASKSDVRRAIKRADKLGDIIDEIVKTLEETEENYSEYCRLKSDIIKDKLQYDYILTEIDEELKLSE